MHLAHEASGVAADTTFEVLTADGALQRVCADTYELEGPLTTFFDTGGRERPDSWSVRLLSIRTTDIASIRRVSGSLESIPVAGVA